MFTPDDCDSGSYDAWTVTRAHSDREEDTPEWNASIEHRCGDHRVVGSVKDGTPFRADPVIGTKSGRTFMVHDNI